jgi:DNA-binding transcriptional ArsR family regulator
LLSDNDLRWLAKVSDAAAVLRASVYQDRQGHILCLPETEVGTELAQGFSRIARGFLFLGLDDWKPYIERLAWDCMPSIRFEILRCLQKGPQTVNQLELDTGIPQRTIYYHIEELEMLKVVKDINGTIELIISLP